MKTQQERDEFLRVLSIWVTGWSIFVLIEVVMRIITSHSARSGNSAFPVMALLSLLAYILFAITACVILHCILKLLSGRRHPRLRRFGFDCLHMAACITAMFFLHAYAFLNDRFFTGFDGLMVVLCNAGLIGSAFIVFVVTFKGFAAVQNKSKEMIYFLAFIPALNIFLEIALYRDQSLIPERISVTDITDCAILIAFCIVFFFLARLIMLLMNKFFNRSYYGGTLKAATVFLIVMATVAAVLIFNRNEPAKSYLNYKISTLENKYNLILIVMDTTRQDHLSCYGYNRQTTPNLEALSRESLLYTNAYSPSSWTLPSHASIMTGLYPSQHGAHFNVESSSEPAVNKLHDNFITLAEVLSEHGYISAGVVGATFCHRIFGIAQGFDYYNDDFQTVDHDLGHYIVFRITSKIFALKNYFARRGFNGVRKAAELNKIIFPWLETNYARPLFLFINYFDAHWPYSPPAPYNTLFEGKSDGLIIKNHGNEWKLFGAVIKGGHRLKEEEKAHLLSQYDGEIAYLDYHIGRLLEKLKVLGIYDESIIIITADHGESFGEHNLMDHGRALYEELLKIPLIIKYPASLKNSTLSR